MGKQAMDKGLFTPKKIFWGIHPGKKLDKEELLPAHRKKLEEDREKAEEAKEKAAAAKK